MKHYNDDDDDDLLLESEKSANEKFEKGTLYMVFGVSVVTTFLFGVIYLHKSTDMIVNLVPLDEGMQQFISRIFGGLLAVTLLDYGYLRWQQMGSQKGLSIRQIEVAEFAEQVCLYLSVSYSVTSISLTSFIHLLPEAVITGIEWYGLITTTGVMAMHALVYHQWHSASHKVVRRRSVAKKTATRMAEHISWLEYMEKQATKLMRQKADAQSERIADAAANMLSGKLIDSFVGNRILPAGRGGYSEPQSPQAEPQSPQSSVTFTPDEPTATIDVSGDTERFRNNNL